MNLIAIILIVFFVERLKIKIGPCPFGQVVAFGQTSDNSSQCPFNGNEIVPLVSFEDGRCYPLGSQRPCRRQPFQLFGYDVFERRTLCVNVTAIGSPYFELDEDTDVWDINYSITISFYPNTITSESHYLYPIQAGKGKEAHLPVDCFRCQPSFRRIHY